MNKRFVLFALFLPLAALLPSVGRADAAVVARGLVGPIKLDITGNGTLLVSERGTGNNDGRLTAIDGGTARVLLSGLPSGLEVLGQPAGPTAVKVSGCCTLYLAIGEGDTLRFTLATVPHGVPYPTTLPPGAQVPNPFAVSSPLMSSVLSLTFDAPIDAIHAGFELTRADHDTLADGFPVRLSSSEGRRLWIRLAHDFKDFRPDAQTNVRASNPFGMTFGANGHSLLLADGGGNSVLQLDVVGPPKTLLRFPPVPNPPGAAGPPLTDAVPTSIRHLKDDQYLVSLFGGVPFEPGTGSVRVVDVRRRTQRTLIPGLWAVTDVAARGSSIYVLEFISGRLLHYATPSSAPTPLAADLVTPSAMVYSSQHRAFFVTELAAGQVRRVGL
jgi:hypothetical protein